jgi:hypothetical protein
LRDTSAAGGQRDQESLEPKELVAPAYPVNGRRYAFALYRSPRNFETGGSGNFVERSIDVLVCVPGRLGGGYDHTVRKTIRIIRPLVLFLHGTFSDRSTWEYFAT